MRLMGNLIFRMFMVSIGYFCAVIAAGLFVAIGFHSELNNAIPPMDAWEAELSSWISVTIGIASAILIGAYTFTIAGLVIILAEIMRWNGLVTNILLGGACAGVLGYLGLGPDGLGETSDGAVLVALAAGFVGGFVYWVIAGSNAGNWRGLKKPAKS